MSTIDLTASEWSAAGSTAAQFLNWPRPEVGLRSRIAPRVPTLQPKSVERSVADATRADEFWQEWFGMWR